MFRNLICSFGGFKTETNHFIAVGAVNAMLVEQCGELFGDQEVGL